MLFIFGLVALMEAYQAPYNLGSTDHRGTPEYPGRTVTLETAEGEVCVSFFNKHSTLTSQIFQSFSWWSITWTEVFFQSMQLLVHS